MNIFQIDWAYLLALIMFPGQSNCMLSVNLSKTWQNGPAQLPHSNKKNTCAKEKKPWYVYSQKRNLLVRFTNPATANICLSKAKVENNIVSDPQAAASVSGRSLLTITGLQYTALVLMIRHGMRKNVYKQKMSYYRAAQTLYLLQTLY